MRFSDARIDAFIEEDVPYIDLTCEVLGSRNQSGEMEYFTREICVLAGIDVARRIMRNLDCEVLASSKDGQEISAGQTFFTVRGAAADLHAAWKACLNVFDHLSAVATKTRSMVDAAHEVNPACEILTTRKSMPGAKDLLTCAVMAGGACPHRLGLSETVLVFEQHLAFFWRVRPFRSRIASHQGTLRGKETVCRSGCTTRYSPCECERRRKRC